MEQTDVDEIAEDDLDTAWRMLESGLDDILNRALSSSLNSTPADRARLYRWLLQAKAMVHNMIVAPDWDNPTFLTNTLFEPGTYSWLMPNPDFGYRYAFLHGARHYRIEGKPGTAHFLEAQVISGLWGDPAIRLLGNSNFADFTPEPDGSLSILVGPEAPGGGANWIATDPAGEPNILILRECFNDWQAERPAQLRIRALDAEPAAMELGAPGLASRLRAALPFVQFCYDVFGGGLSESVWGVVGLNRFQLLDTSRDADAANPSASYLPMIYALADDEALIIEVEVPAARYWSLHVGDLWLQASDYVHHQSSLNGHQIQIDADGRARLIISKQDPGFANWLDPVGRLDGICILRWYMSDRHPIPSTQLVKIDALSRHLPSEAGRVDAKTRAAIVARRTDAVLSRYGR